MSGCTGLNAPLFPKEIPDPTAKLDGTAGKGARTVESGSGDVGIAKDLLVGYVRERNHIAARFGIIRRQRWGTVEPRNLCSESGIACGLAEMKNAAPDIRVGNNPG